MIDKSYRPIRGASVQCQPLLLARLTGRAVLPVRPVAFPGRRFPAISVDKASTPTVQKVGVIHPCHAGRMVNDPSNGKEG